jgi:hypothetical protein
MCVDARAHRWIVDHRKFSPAETANGAPLSIRRNGERPTDVDGPSHKANELKTKRE